ncbi:putative protein glutamine dumper [Helianthus annuus]|uniref:Glutamine dumper 3 n=1 Tax=Helianthus annuus TaxID=4232 RepID=A0A251TMB8_HELAN|nr:protein GLUTAMINE DUMPER 2 [Helianthus annuus]KAF5787550.1 putative protein glutamine dumper [Helianthus annuus]KAJ0514758.1 putative protein glutamine dumper [Helianthus annuus]KAJ0523048.1 putative protein glutamine dumper [Helianthus annuus]KAJ0530912.1 putative protein glutamine dumper [Helianthus annuus]KAJ0697783.1 putative protein glutamine dumper [Helianthus annuus]
MAAVSSISPSPAVAPQPSPWHSPIPYLFGGLAAMMGLVCFALMVLACSYWKLSGYLDHNEGDVESGSVNADGNLPSENHNNNNNRLELCDIQEKCLVIMAGENKPTFLATPSSSRTTSFGSSSWRSSLTGLTESGSSSSEVENGGRDENMTV